MGAQAVAIVVVTPVAHEVVALLAAHVVADGVLVAVTEIVAAEVVVANEPCRLLTLLNSLIKIQ